MENTKDILIYNKDKNNQKKRPFLVDIEEYPFKSNWYEKDGVSMHYIDEGEGVPIVLTHGNPDWSFLNRNIIKEMSKSARVIAYDLPGFGFSDTPTDFGYTPKEHSEWVESLLIDHLNLEKFYLVGQDWGGPTGINVATNHPDRILGLVISNTWAWKSTGALVGFSNSFKTEEKEKLIYEENFFVSTLMKNSINEKSRNSKAIMDAYEMAMPTPERRKGTLIFPQQITESEEWLTELDKKLPSLIGKPVELIFGEKDMAVASPEIIEKWRTYFPDANLQLLPNAGHFTQEDAPESFVFSLNRLLGQL